jgi:cytochrome P450
LANGAKADRVVVQKGATITVEVEVINHSRTVWGPDAWEFRPERWLEPLPECAQAIAGYHHLVTFGDGPKVYVLTWRSVFADTKQGGRCLGRSFAIANLKTLLSALIRRYTFELPDGQDTKIVEKFTLVVRPAVEGQAGFAIPMKIKRIDEA